MYQNDLRIYLQRKSLFSLLGLRIYSILLLSFLDELFLFVNVNLFDSFCRLIVQNDQISVTNIKARKMITCIFGVEYVLVNDKGSSFGFCCGASIKLINKINLIISLKWTLFNLHSNLSNRAIFTKNIIHLFRRYLIRQISHKQNSIYLGW